MSKTIEVISVDTEQQTKNNRDFEVMTVTFKDQTSGKVDAKKLFGFSTDKPLWSQLKGATKGTVLTVNLEKNDRGYWDWKFFNGEVVKGASTAPRSNWETPEERAARQVYIIRQSSIASAVELLKDHGKQPNADAVIEVARKFEDYVLGNLD